MTTQSLGRRMLACLASVVLLAFSGWAGADPPSRVARLAYTTGAVSFSPAGDNDWVQATVNRPLTTGDRLWVEDGARTELQTGGALVRMGARTSVSVLNLDDRITQLQLTQGTMNVRVRRLGPDEVFEVDTPNLAFTLREPGAYRIEVDPDHDTTTIFVRQGQGEAYGEEAAYVIDSRQPYRFTGNDLREYEYVDAPRADDFDHWSGSRDRRYDDSRSARYVSEDVVGYQDLDEYGNWRADATYGNVWYPNRVASDWAPYRDGHWAWIDPWGWTWVDDAPWGFAVSHYGRWAHLGGAWGWVPGPVRSRAYYAPALVVFVGGDNFQITISSGLVGGIAWFPLGPREVYRPAYRVSRRYFENVNRSNTVINNTVINNYYNNSNVTNVIYANRSVEGAVVAVPRSAFVQSQPVSRSAVRVSREIVGRAPIAVTAPVAPTQQSLRGAAAQGDKPPPRALERRVVARTAPPPAPVDFAAQAPQLSARPGKPLDESERKQLRRAPAPAVKVIEQKREGEPTVAPPTARRPPAVPDAGPGEAGGRSEPRGRAEERVKADVTPPEPPSEQKREGGATAPPPTARRPPSVPDAGPGEAGGRSERRGRAEERVKASVTPPESPSPATQEPAAPLPPLKPPLKPPVKPAEPAEIVPPQATPAAPVVPSREPRSRSEVRGNVGPREGGAREREGAVAPPPAKPAEPATRPPEPAASQAEAPGQGGSPAAGTARDSKTEREAQKAKEKEQEKEDEERREAQGRRDALRN